MKLSQNVTVFHICSTMIEFAFPLNISEEIVNRILRQLFCETWMHFVNITLEYLVNYRYIISCNS